jgi:hypothetical protein
MEKLPPIFDLLWEVKTMEQVETIAKGEADCSDAGPHDLYDLFQSQGMDIPNCLEKFKTHYIWVHQNGHWQVDKPLPDEMRGYRRAEYR